MTSRGRGAHLAPLRVDAFRWFFSGEVVNTAGSTMSAIAFPFAVLEVSNSAAALGVVEAAYWVPTVAFMLIGGAIADRLPRTLVLQATNLIQGAVQGAIAVLVLTGRAEIWEIAALAVAAGLASAVGYPAFHGMVPILLPESERKAGFLLIGQAEGLVRIVGPALAGVLVATVGPGWLLGFDAVTFAVAAGFLGLLRLPAGARPERQAGVLGDFRAGWSYARSLGWVIPGSCCALAFNALIAGGLSVLGPVIAKATIGSSGFGLARAAEAVGGLAFTLVLARLTIRHPMRWIMVGFALSGVPMLVLALWVQTAALAVAMMVMGAAMSTLMLAWNLLVQQQVREDMLSRIQSIDGFFSFVAMPIGQLAVGPLAHVYGTRSVELGCAVLCGVVAVVALSRPVLWRLRLQPVDRASAVT